MAAQPLEVEKRIRAPLAPVLQFPCFSHPDGHIGTGLAAGLVVQGGAFAGHGQVQVDTVQQRPGQLVAVPCDLLGAAPAAACGVAQVAGAVRVTW